MSRPRQNFTTECELAINKQINMELYASYVYLSMAYHFDRSDVALPGLHHYFKKASDEERGHAMKLLDYQNKRGGTIVLEDIKMPTKSNWGTAKDAMIEALSLEKVVNADKLVSIISGLLRHKHFQFVDTKEEAVMTVGAVTRSSELYLRLVIVAAISKQPVSRLAVIQSSDWSLLEIHALASTHNDPNLLDFLESEYLQEQVDAIKEISDHVTNLERVGEGLGVFIFDKELKE